MFVLEFLPAAHGDCTLARWDSDHVIVVDGGPDGVYEGVLRLRLIALAPHPKVAPVIDVLCISHVDDDHIAGAVRLLRELDQAKKGEFALPIDLRRIWFNSLDDMVAAQVPGLPQALNDLMVMQAPEKALASSYAQGNDVRKYASALGLDGNAPFDGVLKAGAVNSLDGLDVTVICPGCNALKSLALKWQEAVARKDIKVAAAAYHAQTPQNLSSIVLHQYREGRTALLTGDTREDHLVAGLELAKLLQPGGTMHVDIFKLPHHGSSKNCSPDMFKRIRANHYIVSADGKTNNHPTPETLEWLVKSRDSSNLFTIHLTNAMPGIQARLEKLGLDRAFRVSVGIPRVEISL